MKQILVAVGVIHDPHRGYFICRRASHQHQGGKWEFPGGKVETGETVLQALSRELNEEICVFRFVRPPVPVSSGQAFRCDPASMI